MLIDTGGVGYVVHCSERTLAALPATGAAVALWTEMVVREDLIQLFGFPTPVEREWHRLLMTVQGVGARGALGILGALGSDGLARALALGDAGAIRSAPGIGPKIAQRVVLELKAKAPAVLAMGAGRAPRPRPEPAGGAGRPGPRGAGAGGRALGARQPRLRRGGGGGGGGGADRDRLSDLIRAALRALAPKG